jgi:hypothetical protein
VVGSSAVLTVASEAPSDRRFISTGRSAADDDLDLMLLALRRIFE